MANNPLLIFKDEILTDIILPKIITLLHDDKKDLSVNDLWKSFRETYNCTVSQREFKEWCNELGLSPQQKTVWNIPCNKSEVNYSILKNNHTMTPKTFTKIETDSFNRMLDNEPVDPNINFDNE